MYRLIEFEGQIIPDVSESEIHHHKGEKVYKIRMYCGTPWAKTIRECLLDPKTEKNKDESIIKQGGLFAEFPKQNIPQKLVSRVEYLCYLPLKAFERSPLRFPFIF